MVTPARLNAASRGSLTPTGYPLVGSELRFEALLQKQCASSLEGADSIAKKPYKMAKIIVNLTLPLIHEKIEKFLAENCNYFYQQAFDLPDLRQELITYVWSRINISYIAIEEGKQQSIKSKKLDQLVTKRLHLETVIEEGISDILTHKTKGEQHIIE